MGNLLKDLLSNLWDWFTDIGIQLLWAALIIVAILAASRWLRRRLNRGLLTKHVNPNVVNLINIFSKMFVYSLIFIVLLRVFGVDSSSLATTVGLVAGAITLSLQDVLKNLVSGIYLLVEQPFQVGDRIEVSKERGVVEKVDIRTTVLRNDYDEAVLVPNYKVFSEVVLNRSTKSDAADLFKLEGSKVAPVEARETVTKIASSLSFAREPVIEVTKAGPETFDYEIKLWWKVGATDRFALVSCLRDHFPEATITREST
jgi:small-conductance mechanosensitive channel